MQNEIASPYPFDDTGFSGEFELMADLAPCAKAAHHQR
jgi:hypothetical protein